MPRYHISEEQEAELEKARKKNKDKNIEKRLKALLMHAEGKNREEIAQQTGFDKSHISKLVSKYCNKGIASIVENHYPGCFCQAKNQPGDINEKSATAIMKKTYCGILKGA